MKKYKNYILALLFSLKKHEIKSKSKSIEKERYFIAENIIYEPKTNELKIKNNPLNHLNENIQLDFNCENLTNQEKENAKKMSYSKIINLYTNFKNLTHKTARYFLIVKKYEKLYKKNGENNEQYEKYQKYNIKLNNIKEEVIDFFSKNKELKTLIIAAKFKNLDIDEELFTMAYKYAMHLINNKEQFSIGKSKLLYYANKNKEDYIKEKKINELQEEIQIIKNKNIEIANSFYKIKEFKKLPKNYYKIYKKLHMLVETSYLTQMKLEQAYFMNHSVVEINQLKETIKITHKNTLELLKHNKKEINEMLELFPAQYYSNHLTLFAPSLLRNKLDFIHKTDLYLQFILKGKNILVMIEIRKVLKNEDNLNNKILKKVLKTIIELENL